MHVTPNPHKRTRRRFLVGVLALALLAGACGNGGDSTAGRTRPAPPASTDLEPTTSAPLNDDGWLGSEPVWLSEEWESESAAAAEYSAPEAAPAPTAVLAPPPATVAVSIAEARDAAEAALAAAELALAIAEGNQAAVAAAEAMLAGAEAADLAEFDTAGDDMAGVARGTVEEPAAGRLTGGSIDDNEDFERYLSYRSLILQLGIPVRDLDPTGRMVVTVTGRGGRPLAGVEVAVAGGGVEVSLHTTADGTVRFHPEAYGAADGPFTVTAGEAGAEVWRGGSMSLEIDRPATGDDVALDVLFLLDTTGSMADEIDQLKSTIREVAQRIGDLPGEVDLRLGMTLYRDVGDTFVTANFNFTSDVDHFTRALGAVVADGGGDNPEALDEALADALARPTWRPAKQAVQLVFLIADAPPQIARQVPIPYTESMIEAAARGIKIFPVSSSGSDDQTEFVFRQLAQFTGARYVFLTYGAGGRATGGATDIGERDYEDLSLDDLIVRLVTEEIAGLAGTALAPPPHDRQTPPAGQDTG